MFENHSSQLTVNVYIFQNKVMDTIAPVKSCQINVLYTVHIFFFLISMSLLWEVLFSMPCSMESWQKTAMRSVSLMWNLQPFWLCLS